MEDKNKKDDLQKAVHSKIKGLGLDALFHQVDKGEKDGAIRHFQSSAGMVEMIWLTQASTPWLWSCSLIFKSE